MTRVGLATSNPGKVREIAAIVPSEITVVPPPDGWIAPPETGETYRENALLKARALVGVLGIACMADDSGIEVDALGGAPGPLSARFSAEGSDEANLRKLIDAIERTPEEARGARYRCVAVLVHPSGHEHIAEATVEGRLLTQPRGSGGFGYDPIFVPLDGDGRTMAELSPADKDAISHRGKAFRALSRALRAL